MKAVDYLLFEFVRKGDFKKVKRLINEGADVNAHNEYGETPLHIACNTNKTSLEILDLLLENGVDVDAQSVEGQTPLHLACSNGTFEIVKKLVDSGAKVEVSDQEDQTPLKNAKMYVDIIEFLVENGANIETYDEDTNNFLLLDVAGKLNKPELAELFLSKINKEKVFNNNTNLVHNNVYFPKIAEMLVKAGADVNYLNEYNETALAIAVKEGLTDSVKVLLNNGASTKYRDKEYDNNSLLHIATEYNYYEISKLLLDNGMKTDILNNMLETPLHLAASSDAKEIAELLLERGADINAKNKYGRTPVDYVNDKNTSTAEFIKNQASMKKNK